MKKIPKFFLHLLTHPGRTMLSPFYRRIEKRYIEIEKFEIRFLLTDIALLLIALGIVGSTIGWFVWHNRPGDKIFFEAQVSPMEITVGAPSTLLIHYTNGTGQELKNVYLTVSYPEHFYLQELSVDETLTEGNIIAIGNLAPDAIGSLKIRGLMFGEVGNEQIFESKISFTYGEKNRSGEKTARHVFSPSRSTLQLSLELPEHIIVAQTLSGKIIGKNSGEQPITFLIEPSWPDGSSIEFENKKENYTLNPGEETVWLFSGQLNQKQDQATFVFEPYLVFEQTRYRQEILDKTIELIPAPLILSHAVETSPIVPGGKTNFIISYKNNGNEPIENLSVGIDSTSRFLLEQSGLTTETIARIEPGQSGTVSLWANTQSLIRDAETSVYENLTAETTAAASYSVMIDGIKNDLTYRGPTTITPIASQIRFDSFGRYATERGDQLGRGPLPPIVGEETKYWIFWTVSDTTNKLKTVSVSGKLSDNVSFTGRQSVSEGSAVNYDETTKIVTWQTETLAPSFAPTTKTLGLAFEISLTPTEEQIKTSPLLISDVFFSAVDDWTGSLITASGDDVTTDLPGDLMANGLGMVGE